MEISFLCILKSKFDSTDLRKLNPIVNGFYKSLKLVVDTYKDFSNN